MAKERNVGVSVLDRLATSNGLTPIQFANKFQDHINKSSYETVADAFNGFADFLKDSIIPEEHKLINSYFVLGLFPVKGDVESVRKSSKHESETVYGVKVKQESGDIDTVYIDIENTNEPILYSGTLCFGSYSVPEEEVEDLDDDDTSDQSPDISLEGTVEPSVKDEVKTKPESGHIDPNLVNKNKEQIVDVSGDSKEVLDSGHGSTGSAESNQESGSNAEPEVDEKIEDKSGVSEENESGAFEFQGSDPQNLQFGDLPVLGENIAGSVQKNNIMKEIEDGAPDKLKSSFEEDL